MDYKIENLKEKIYQGFVRGEYGAPKIPSPNEVLEKLETITDPAYVPIVTRNRMANIDYQVISGQFSSLIDDIDILFESIEDESRDVLDQLTASLKEHNGVKRELRRITSRANDIINRRLGDEYLEYNFTESFDDVGNINTVYSDPIDTDAGTFSILSSSSNLLTLNHYRDRKLEFNVVETYSTVEEYGYVGETNATTILSKGDPRSISYRIRTKAPTRLRVALAMQLLPDGKPIEINSVGISLDSAIAKGYIRLYYQKNFQWKDVPALSIQEIKGDNVVFTFPKTEATHIKFEFIKEFPDVPSSNEYFVTINEIAISKSITKSQAKLYSKPIIVDKYSTELPVVSNISCITDADVPDGCSVKVFVSQDIKLSGQFIDSNGASVYADSLEAVNFNPLATGFVYLSDIWARDGVSGLDPYRGLDFNWKEIKPTDTAGNSVPDTIEFNNSASHDPVDNSLFNVSDWYLFGDKNYLGPWPQYPSYGTIFISGWCNSNNSQWIPFLSGAVSSGWFISGVDVAALHSIDWGLIEDSEGNINPTITGDLNYSGQWLGYGKGYPFNYFIEDENRYLKFGDYEQAVNGWWRPFSIAVDPTGISPVYGSGEFLNHSLYGSTLPDFYFNGVKFYKMYKFGYVNNVIDSSIKLYMYETRPVTYDSDYYDHNFTWSYRSNWSMESKTLLDIKDSIHMSDTDFTNYVLTLPKLSQNEEYTIDGITDFKLHNSSVTFSPEDYLILGDSFGNPSGISLLPFNLNQPQLKPSSVSFDITCSYRVKNKYQSAWSSYAIVSPGTLGSILVKNSNIYTTVKTNKKIIDKIVIEDLDNNTKSEKSDDGGKIIFNLDASDSSTNKHFKVTIFCASDESSGFSARSERNKATHFIPSEARRTIEVSRGIRFVSKLESLKIVDLSALIYDTPMTNDRRCALITEYNGEKYLVSKIPSKDGFPGYYFDNISGNYFTDPRVMMTNRGHYVRKINVKDSITSEYSSQTWTTGSSGVAIKDPWLSRDSSWNNGSTLPAHPNTVATGIYQNHSTWGYPITLDDVSTLSWIETVRSGMFDLRVDNRTSGQIFSPGWSGWAQEAYPNDITKWQSAYAGAITISGDIPNRGFLFYNTGENLPAFYSISYRTVKNTDESFSRFLYKLELESNGSRSVIPKVRSIRFRVNRVD